MQRLLTSATLVLLLVATAAAFAITERLKLTKSAIYGTVVSQTLSAHKRADVRIILRRSDHLTIEVVDARGREVKILYGAQAFRRGEVAFRWDGTTDAGRLAPDGTYRIRIHFANQHQTIVLPNRMQLDTNPPVVEEVTQNRDAFSPDDDKQADFVRLNYRLNKPARLLVYVGGRRVLKTYFHPQKGSASWYGLARGRLLRPGQYTLEIGAVDPAGNVTPADQRVRIHVRLRYITLASQRIVARVGKPFEIGVSTDAVRYEWKLGKRTGRSRGAVLKVKAPQRRGLYTLTVSERGHVDRAKVLVR